MGQPSIPVNNSVEDVFFESLGFLIKEEPTLGSQQRSRQSTRKARTLASEISKVGEESSEMIKEDRKKQRQDAAQHEHEKFKEMAKEVMNVHIPLLEQSDWCDFIKRIEPREERHSDLIIINDPWSVILNRSRDDAQLGKSIVARDLPLVDEALNESCLLMRKVLAKNGTFLGYNSVEDLT